ncbi:MAG: hypothetical protein ACKVQC_05070 [Elusimicrobiota bacterium]
MKQNEIKQYLEELNAELSYQNVKGEICLYGGAVMTLVYNARPSTKDVDAVFEPASVIRGAAVKISKKNQLPEDWINDAVKGFVVPHDRHVFFDFSHLKVFIPEADYLLAMKALAARVDGTDKLDVKFLVKNMNIKSLQEVFAIIEKYYPKQRIKPATQFFLEELFENDFN